MPLAGFRGRVAGQGIRDQLKAFGCTSIFDFCPIRSLHAKLITSETNIKLRHITYFQQTQVVGVTRSFLLRQVHTKLITF